jgi:hypothetical protein
VPEVQIKAPAVQGELGDRPLPRLLQQLYRKQFTGHFVVTDQTKDESEVYVRDGSPVHVCRPVDTDRLDNLLVEYGLVPAEIVAEASAQVSEGQRLGDVLERMGALDKDKLAGVLKAQVTRKLTRLFFVHQGSYAVYLSPHGFGLGGDLQLMRIDPRAVIYPGIRAAYDLPRATRELARLAGQRFRLANVSPAFVAALGVSPEDATVEALRGGWLTLDDLDDVTSRPFEVRSVVLAMYYTDSLERENLPARPGDLAGERPSASTGRREGRSRRALASTSMPAARPTCCGSPRRRRRCPSARRRCRPSLCRLRRPLWRPEPASRRPPPRRPWSFPWRPCRRYRRLHRWRCRSRQPLLQLRQALQVRRSRRPRDRRRPPSSGCGLR